MAKKEKKVEEARINGEEFFAAAREVAAKKGISLESVVEGIKQAMLKACDQNYGTAQNIVFDICSEPKKEQFRIFRQFDVVEEVTDQNTQIALSDALLVDPSAQAGDIVREEVNPMKNFSRIAAQNGKSIILQRVREEERQSVLDNLMQHDKNIMTGKVIRMIRDGMYSISLDKGDALLTKDDLIPGEVLRPEQRIKVYVKGMREESKKDKKGQTKVTQRIWVTRTAPGFVKRLFEQEVTEIKDGVVEIMSISREPGSRTKMAVLSHDENVDPIGACIGVNGCRINAVCDELNGEKIDIIRWDENPAYLVENALSPAKVIAVAADEDEQSALVVVPDNQLSLAIGMKGQNARLAAKLTGYKIDIKSESQAREAGYFDEYEEQTEEASEDEE